MLLLAYSIEDLIFTSRPSRASRYVAVKVYITHANLNRELEIYKHLNSASSNHPGRKCVRMLLDSFEIAGPHGTHTCLVHRPLGKSLLELMKLLDGGVLNKDLLKPAMRQVLGALYYLHEEAGVIHTDLQPSNILLGIKDDSILSKYEENELKHPVPRKVTPDRTIYVSRPLPVSFGIPVLCDLGEARLESEKNDDDIMPDIYRAPEVILGMHWDNQVDIWNAGMLTWDLFQAFHLFHARDPGGKLHDAYHLASIASVLGPPPSEFLKKSENSLRYWDENGHWRGLVPIPEHRPLDMLDQRLTGDDKQGFVSFLKKMLCWAPEDRATAGDLLLDPWLIEGMFKSRPPSANN
ncbi:hypothetical protein PRK78_002794 [Emydomyces testavorans]|uniref:non-specific serine/threonine protein kinase n=1 Tax=Emydomyces testavorans TaxID=2070801 RepID=A0AAF0IK03_9EURO|nr:hypothetical protein PRK78_002794 [Emydomyces testavorans]